MQRSSICQLLDDDILRKTDTVIVQTEDQNTVRKIETQLALSYGIGSPLIYPS